MTRTLRSSATSASRYIDPVAETRHYTEEVLAAAGQGLDAQGRALLVTDPVLRARRNHEAVHLRELASHVTRTVLEPWHADVLAARATCSNAV